MGGAGGESGELISCGPERPGPSKEDSEDGRRIQRRRVWAWKGGNDGRRRWVETAVEAPVFLSGLVEACRDILRVEAYRECFCLFTSSVSIHGRRMAVEAPVLLSRDLSEVVYLARNAWLPASRGSGVLLYRGGRAFVLQRRPRVAAAEVAARCRGECAITRDRRVAVLNELRLYASPGPSQQTPRLNGNSAARPSPIGLFLTFASEAAKRRCLRRGPGQTLTAGFRIMHAMLFIVS